MRRGSSAPTGPLSQMARCAPAAGGGEGRGGEGRGGEGRGRGGEGSGGKGSGGKERGWGGEG